MQRHEFRWRGETLYHVLKPVAYIKADMIYPRMYRYTLSDGWRSGLLNLSRAKDGAIMDVMYLLKTRSYAWASSRTRSNAPLHRQRLQAYRTARTD